MSHREGYRRFRGTWQPSAAQRRVLDGVAAGHSNAEIASALGLSAETVKWHIAKLLAESGCEHRDALGRWWAERRRQPAVFPLLAIVFRTAAVLAVVGLLLAAIFAGVALHTASSHGSNNGLEKGIVPPDSSATLELLPERPTPAAGPFTPITSTTGPVKRIRLTVSPILYTSIDQAPPEFGSAVQQYVEDLGATYYGDCFVDGKVVPFADGDTCAFLEIANDEQASILLIRFGPVDSLLRVTFQPRDGRWLPFAVERLYPRPRSGGSSN